MNLQELDPWKDCDTINLSEIGTIQNAGYLFVIQHSINDIKIIGVSDNIMESNWGNNFIDPNLILDKSIHEVFDSNQATVINMLVTRFQALYRSKPVVSAVKSHSMLNTTASTSAHIAIQEHLLCCTVVQTSNPDILILEFEWMTKISETGFLHKQILQSGGKKIGNNQNLLLLFYRYYWTY